MCDPVYALMLKRPEVQEEFFSQLSPQERECFFCRDESGKSYSDLMRVSEAQIAEAIRIYRDGAENCK